MQKLIRLVYLSEAVHPFSRRELEALAGKSALKNRDTGVTGILLYSCGTFVQCLEGPAPAVRRLFALIETDRRHTRVMQVSNESVEKRLFGHWWMGLLNVDEDASPLHRAKLLSLVRGAREGSKVNVVRLLQSFRKALPAGGGAMA